MAPWQPGPDPFPARDVTDITNFEYLGELKFVRHAKVHVDKPPRSLWQLSANFSARMTVHTDDGNRRYLGITAPKGMFTDLASVPKALCLVAGPIGDHLEASILHDYLYMAWTDHRERPLKRDRDFADTMFRVGMKASGVGYFKRVMIHTAVRLLGWNVFRSKSYTFAQRMNDWLPLLSTSHGRDDGDVAALPSSSVPGRSVARSGRRR